MMYERWYAAFSATLSYTMVMVVSGSVRMHSANTFVGVLAHVIVYSSDAMSHSAGASMLLSQSKTPTSSVWCGTVGV